jgi:hypothetical protein
MAITPWLHYADPTLAPLCRSPRGSNVPISDTYQLSTFCQIYREWAKRLQRSMRQRHTLGGAGHG